MKTPAGRLRIAVLFGGRSAEHNVSVLSASNVMRALDPEKYEAVPIYVTRAGQWLLSSYRDGALAKPAQGTEVALLPGGQGRMLAVSDKGTAHEVPRIDVLFPVLHGLHGEDGAVQGLCEVARVPLAGCGVLGSATALDKDIAKRLFNEAGLPTVRAVTVHVTAPPPFAEIEDRLGLPVFVKPARQGSSVGVSKVAREQDYQAALAEGFKHDRKLLVEAFVKAREIEFAILEDPDGDLFVSRPGEIVPAEQHGFYSYDAKYIDADGAALMIPAEMPEEMESRMRDMAKTAFRALGCDGMARADFFVTDTQAILVNELNTIPGFTDISMYSKVMAASGVGYAQVIDRLVAHGLARAGRSG
ncbi:D-alanine--D-alanine ligase [Stappia stellulata]|uniref:D-alanine--D-alanine ligase family protein n=1 Tax=Stappia stellulata TaxID=71235 RepID=UPI001CD24136|nr:D-alanine--D-alanine ligase family protein [Stappia stellulata]MCA1241773.1 D-alanine--D-alanine ligase [Stappia stellulata]